MRVEVVVSMLLTTGHLLAGELAITHVEAQQRYPWNGKVDISYTVEGALTAHCQSYGLIPRVKVSATDKDTSATYVATRLSGDVALTDGLHRIAWDLDAEGISIKSTNVVFDVSCEADEAPYCVIDLSAGVDATSYPVTYLAEEPDGGFNVDEYKTTKLVLKRIAPGSFIMGEDQTDQSHKVTLTKPFYMGLFEVTQKQWTLVMGENPAHSYSVGDTYPIHTVSYDMIRGNSEGAKWPSSAKVDEWSFLGKLVASTGLNFDLPTTAQWEYACRAGTTTDYYWGASVDLGAEYVWYLKEVGKQSQPVGGLKPNEWELYDMSGNVWEWTLNKGLTYGIDPQGPFDGKVRILCGGSWNTRLKDCTSHERFDWWSDGSDSSIGLRLARTLP